MNSSKSKMSSIARKINLDFWVKRLWDVIWLDILLIALVCGAAFIWCEERVPDGENVISREFVIVDIERENIEDNTGKKIGDSVIDNPVADEVSDTVEGDKEDVKQISDGKEGKEGKEGAINDTKDNSRTEKNADSEEVKDEDNVYTDNGARNSKYKSISEADADTTINHIKYVILTDKSEYGLYVSDVWALTYRPFLILFVFQGIHLFFAIFGAGSIRRRMKPLNDLAVKAEQMSQIPLDASKFENLEHAISSVNPDGTDTKIKTGDKELESIEIALNNLLFRMKESQKQQARFVSDASHELRTPISVVQGYVNMLDRWGKEDPEILEEAIEALKHESEHMKELIEQLLFLARGDSGRNTLNKTKFDMNEIMKEVWEESEMIDDKHTYEFEECPMCFVEGDVAMVKQSVRIFVQNASKYSNEGDTIKLGVKCDGTTVSYIVQDEGIGMQEEDVSHIFERFYRSDKARNGETGGSGLGLSIAKWIIDAHMGTIEVLSRPEIGTRFTVSFPVIDNTGALAEVVDESVKN